MSNSVNSIDNTRKKRIYDWYPKLNEFIKRIDDL